MDDSDSFDVDMVMDYADARFEIRPFPTYGDLMKIISLVNELGYKMPYSMKQYSLEDVQERLRSEGPQAFLGIVRLQEDISPKAPSETARDLVAKRLARLGQTSDLLIVDPYLFPPAPQQGEAEYATFLAGLIAPILKPSAKVICVVNEKSNVRVEELTRRSLASLVPEATLSTTRSDDFHDRFWIADRSRGVVVGASLNGLGKRLFFIDKLSKSDVEIVVRELVGLI